LRKYNILFLQILIALYCEGQSRLFLNLQLNTKIGFNTLNNDKDILLPDGSLLTTRFQSVGKFVPLNLPGFAIGYQYKQFRSEILFSFDEEYTGAVFGIVAFAQKPGINSSNTSGSSLGQQKTLISFRNGFYLFDGSKNRLKPCKYTKTHVFLGLDAIMPELTGYGFLKNEPEWGEFFQVEFRSTFNNDLIVIKDADKHINRIAPRVSLGLGFDVMRKNKPMFSLNIWYAFNAFRPTSLVRYRYIVNGTDYYIDYAKSSNSGIYFSIIKEFNLWKKREKQ